MKLRELTNIIGRLRVMAADLHDAASHRVMFNGQDACLVNPAALLESSIDLNTAADALSTLVPDQDVVAPPKEQEAPNADEP